MATEFLNPDSTQTDNIISKPHIKRILREYSEKQLNVGNSFLKVDKASEKWIGITESRKGLVQTHKRTPITSVLQYINYKKALFMKDTTETSSEIDPKTQSKQYQLQHQNFIEVKEDLSAHLEVIFKDYTKLINFNVDEENNKIEIKINHDKTITLQQPNILENGIINEVFNISTNQEDLNDLQNDLGKFKFLKGYYHICSLLYESSKESIHFLTTIKRLISFKKNLKLLVSFVNSEENLSVIEDSKEIDKTKSEIKEFIRKCKKMEMLTLNYEDFDANGISYKREFVIHKQTKIRTIVRVFATSTIDPEVRFTEFSRTYTKVNQDLDKITNEMYDLYIANH